MGTIGIVFYLDWEEFMIYDIIQKSIEGIFWQNDQGII